MIAPIELKVLTLSQKKYKIIKKKNIKLLNFILFFFIHSINKTVIIIVKNIINIQYLISRFFLRYKKE